jgi:hypothetical protein
MHNHPESSHIGSPGQLCKPLCEYLPLQYKPNQQKNHRPDDITRTMELQSKGGELLYQGEELIGEAPAPLIDTYLSLTASGL